MEGWSGPTLNPTLLLQWLVHQQVSFSFHPVIVKVKTFIWLLLLFSCSVMSTPCNPMDCVISSFPVLYHLPELAQTHVHWVSSAIQPCHPVAPFSFCPQSFSASGSFQMSWLCTSGGQRIGASASVFPMNIFLIYTLCICRCIPNIYL